MDEHEENFKDIFRYTDVEYTPDGYTDVYRWDDFLVIAGDHVYSAMDTIDSVSPGGKYEGFDPQYAYTGETFESAFQAGRAFGIGAGAVRTSASTGVERNGLHFYYGDEPKPAPEFFRERHSKTRPIVCLETGETFEGNPAAARPLHVSPAAISQAVRYGTPVDGFHFYHGDEPKPVPEFFKSVKGKGGKSPAEMAAAARAAAGNGRVGVPDGIRRNRHAV